MSLITETGTGDPNSESYISVASADVYHSNAGNTLWATLLLAEKEQALRRATKFMLQTYRLRWKGVRTSLIQALDFPRYNVDLPDTYTYNLLSSTVVPNEVQWANAELALLAAAGDLHPPEKQNVLKKTIGPITIVYDTASPQHVRYGFINQMLMIYLTTTGNTIKLSRC